MRYEVQYVPFTPNYLLLMEAWAYHYHDHYHDRVPRDWTGLFYTRLVVVVVVRILEGGEGRGGQIRFRFRYHILYVVL